MFSRIVSSFRSARQAQSPSPARGLRSEQRRSPMMENLEDRRMFASIQVGSVSADNRGKVLITLIPNGETIDASTINKTSCILYTAGTDGILGTTDDVRERENVVFNSTFNRITISSKQKAGTGYRVRLSATRIRSIGRRRRRMRASSPNIRTSSR